MCLEDGDSLLIHLLGRSFRERLEEEVALEGLCLRCCLGSERLQLLLDLSSG